MTSVILSSHQDLFFEIWSILLDQLKNNSRPERLEKLLDFSCCEQDFLQVSLNKIDQLIEEGIDINLHFPGDMYYNEITQNALYKTLCLYIFGHSNKDAYNNMNSKDYLEELIYFLVHRCQPGNDIIKFMIGREKLYKILEELLKRFEGKIEFENYNLFTKYLEILVGFSCIELNKKVTYSYRKNPALPIESLLIEYVSSFIFDSSGPESISSYIEERNIKERYIQIRDNIFLLKPYSPNPSFKNVLEAVSKDLCFFKIEEEFIVSYVTKTFYYFGFDYNI